MTNKERFILHFRQARTAHIKWLNQIKLIVTGIQNHHEGIALNQSESEFGCWLFDEAISLGGLHSKRLFEESLELHTQCYDKYLEIYHVLFTDKGGLFQGIFGNTKRASKHELKLAQRYYEELVQYSDSMLNRLRSLETQLLAMPQEQFEGLSIDVETVAPVQKVRHDMNGPSYYRGQRID